MGKFSVFMEILHTEVNGSIDLIGKSFVDQGLDHLDHTIDFLGCQRMGGGRHHIHICHIFLAFFDVAGGDFLCAYAFFYGFGNDLIIHISEIGYIVDFIAFVLQIAADRVKDDHGSGVADVDKVVYGRSAHIHFYFSLF